MSKSELITSIAGLPDDDPRLDTVAAALNGDPKPDRPASLRLFSMGAACAALGVSRATLWRLLKEKRLRSVEVRRGSHRINEAELIRFAEGRPEQTRG